MCQMESSCEFNLPQTNYLNSLPPKPSHSGNIEYIRIFSNNT